MNRQKQKVNLLLAQLVIVVAITCGQTLDETGKSSKNLSAGGDGASKDFKLKGPLGVFQLARRSIRVPKAVRSLLPPGAKVRSLQRLTLSPSDTLIVYERSDRALENPLMDITYPGGVVLRQNQIVGRFAVRRKSDDDPDWVFLGAGEVRLSQDTGGIALAFRSMGDGSASLFMVMAADGERYRTVLKRIITEGRLRADQETNLELWGARIGGECVWCDHPYRILAYRWDGARFVEVRRRLSCREIDPDPMTDKPIEGVSHSLSDEYAEAEQLRLQKAQAKAGNHRKVRSTRERPSCDFRDPTHARR